MKTSVKIGGVVGGVLAVTTAFVEIKEGLFTKPYRDPVGIPTVCYGHIEGVTMTSRSYTAAECKALLLADLAVYNEKMLKCVKVPLTTPTHAALLSFSYNVGISGFCKSTVARKLNAGDTAGACDALLMWTKGRVRGRLVDLPGLVTRRKEERALCRSGIK